MGRGLGISSLNPGVRALLRKELRQVGRSRGALVSAALLPILFLLVEPVVQLHALLNLPLGGGSGELLFRHFGGPHALFLRLSLPLFVTLAGVLAAPVLATHTVVAERERRTLDLLMALPASVEEILLAKVVGVFLVGAGIVLSIFALEAALLLGGGLAGLGYVLQVTLVLVGALICSAGITTLVTLVARDYRTSRQISGIPTTAILLLAIAILFALDGTAAIVTLAAVLAGLGAVGLLIASRWLTFERYLS